MNAMVIKVSIGPDSDPELWEHLSGIAGAGPSVKHRAATLRRLALLGLLSLRSKGFPEHTTFTENSVRSSGAGSASSEPVRDDGTTFLEKSVPSKKWPVKEKNDSETPGEEAVPIGIPNDFNAPRYHTQFNGGAAVKTLGPPPENGETGRKLKLDLSFID